MATLKAPAVTDSVYEQTRVSRIASVLSDLDKRLSQAAMARFRAFVENTKQNMKLVPIPNMQNHVGSLWDRLFEPPVHAQNMYYNTTYTTVVGDTTADDTGYFYAYGVTDASAGCSCHEAQVQTTLTSTGGGYVVNNSQGGPYAEVQESYYLQSADFNDDGYITATSVHSAYCPIGNVWFINQEQTVSSNPLQVIRAYYYCNPQGGPCVKAAGFYTHRRCNPLGVCNGLLSRQNNWPFTLQTVAQISISGNLICAADKATAQQMITCSSPDPKPGQ